MMSSHTTHYLTPVSMVASATSGILAVAGATPWWVALLSIIAAIAIPTVQAAAAEWVRTHSRAQVEIAALKAALDAVNDEIAKLRAKYGDA